MKDRDQFVVAIFAAARDFKVKINFGRTGEHNIKYQMSNLKCQNNKSKVKYLTFEMSFLTFEI